MLNKIKMQLHESSEPIYAFTQRSLLGYYAGIGKNRANAKKFSGSYKTVSELKKAVTKQMPNVIFLGPDENPPAKETEKYKGGVITKNHNDDWYFDIHDKGADAKAILYQDETWESKGKGINMREAKKMVDEFYARYEESNKQYPDDKITFAAWLEAELEEPEEDDSRL